jgi:hypothetical protein
MTPLERQSHFKMDTVKVIREYIRRAKLDGVVSISPDCLWRCTAQTISQSQFAPVGTNGAYMAHEVFNALVNSKPFNAFVYL